MSEQLNAITDRVRDFIAEKYADQNVIIHPVGGGYSRNRRAIIEAGGKSLFAKEVDISVLPDDGAMELGWLKKDYEVINELDALGITIVPDWAELHLNGHLLLLPSYKREEDWLWSLPEDKNTRIPYIQAVIDATKQLEATAVPKELTEKLSLQPFFRDEIVEYDGLGRLLASQELRDRLIKNYEKAQEKGGHLLPINQLMAETLRDNAILRHLQEQAEELTLLPNSCFNHCDVRSDNIAYNERTGEVKFVDWNWASYAPAKFGATEFLLDMARRGVDVSPWYKDVSAELLAASVGYFMIRSLKPPLTPGSNLREMQAETAAVANYLYRQTQES